MQHPDPDDLALIALGESVDNSVDAHVAGCAHCSAEVESYRTTVGLADLSNFGEDAARPGEHVWQAIAAELGFGSATRAGSSVATAFGDTGGTAFGDTAFGQTGGTALGDTASSDTPSTGNLSTGAGTGAEPWTSTHDGTSRNNIAADDQRVVDQPGLLALPGSAPPARARRSGSSRVTRWPRWATPLAAAVIGIAIGAGAVIISQNRADQVTVEATAPLTPVPGGPLSGDQLLGQAEIVAAAGGQQVRVQAADLPATTNDYEVWLFGNDGKMVSLGTLSNGSGTFTVPQGISTKEYRVVDVSDEPPDGVPTHSGVSMIRGQFS